MTHWSTPYLGKKWRKGAHGPDEFDCWGLLWWIYLKHLNIKLPTFSGVEDTGPVQITKVITLEVEKGPWMTNWFPIQSPVDMCAVAMGQRHFSHVGIYIESDGGFVLHAGDKQNVAAQRPAFLKARGFARIEYFKHAAHHTNTQSV